MNAITEVHSERRAKLTHYLSFVLKLAVQFPPPLFREYRKHFSRKAASILVSRGRKIDWIVCNDDIYSQIFAGRRARACDKYASVDHSTDFCPAVLHADLKMEFFASSSDDRLGSPLSFRIRRPPALNNDQREVCFNFNGHCDCSNSACVRAHVFFRCLQSHAQKDCRQPSTNTLAWFMFAPWMLRASIQYLLLSLPPVRFCSPFVSFRTCRSDSFDPNQYSSLSFWAAIASWSYFRHFPPH